MALTWVRTHDWDVSAWRTRSACLDSDPDVFFPISEEEAGPALAFCGACRIREECLAWAMKNGERYGVWGGLTERERRRILRQRRKTA